MAKLLIGLLMKLNIIMENNIENILLKAYKEYMLMPLGVDSEIYNNIWCIFTGRSIVEPHPHRYYTLKEFENRVYSDKEFADRFIFNRFTKL